MNGDIVALSFLLTLVSIVAADGTNYCKFDRKECNCIADNGWGVDLRNISHPIKSSDTGEAVYVSFCEDSDVTPNYINGTNSCHSQKYSICNITRDDTVDDKTNKTTTTFNAEMVLRDQGWTDVTKAAGESSIVFRINSVTLRLVCIKDVGDSHLMANNTALYLYHPGACLTMMRPVPHVDGLGTGAVLSIIILVTLFSYLTLGIVYNYFVQGTRGAEIIPNIEFWRQLPGLVMDGIRFIQNGCRPPASSDMASSGGRETYDSI